MFILTIICQLIASAALIVATCATAYITGKYTFRFFDYFISTRDIINMSEYTYDQSRLIKSIAAAALPVIFGIFFIYATWTEFSLEDKDEIETEQVLTTDE